jgi:hypothetical protein
MATERSNLLVDSPLERRWGVAESGEVYEVAVRPHLLDELRRRWPPVGLERRSSSVGPVVARIGLSDAWVVVPDIEASGDSPPPVAGTFLNDRWRCSHRCAYVELVAVHAAVIERDGRTRCGHPGGGKSVLAHKHGGCIRAQRQYALLDPRLV